MVNFQQLIKIAALVAVFFSLKTHATSFITEEMTQPPQGGKVCNIWTGTDRLGEVVTGGMDSVATAIFASYKTLNPDIYRNWSKSVIDSEINPENGICRKVYKFTYDRYRGADYTTPWITGASYDITTSGVPEEQESCPTSDGTGNTASIPTNRFGSLRCMAPNTLFANQNCPSSPSDQGFALPYDGSGNQQVCIEKADGSKCGYSLNENTYVSDVELNCWNENITDDYTLTNEFTPNEDGCGSVGGYNFCEANPEDVCVGSGGSQVCASGCGSVSFGDEEYFGCFDDDNSCNPANEDCGTNPVTPPDDTEEPEEPEGEDETGEFNTEALEALIQGSNDRLDGIQNTAQTISTKLTDTNVKLNTIASGVDITNSELVKTNTKLSNLNATNDDMRNGIGALNDKVDGIQNELKKEIDVTDLTNQAKQAELESLSFYQPKYENGFEDVWDKNYELFTQTSMFQYIESWEVNVTGSDYQFPEICFNLGFANYGCHQITIDPRVFPFIRILMILGALFLARKLTLGG